MYVFYNYYKTLNTLTGYLITFPHLPTLPFFNCLVNGPGGLIHQSSEIQRAETNVGSGAHIYFENIWHSNYGQILLKQCIIDF